ncbi:MAG: hypothetical protein K0S47_2654 [Herbinix sp.]|jgi:hypothetical protein|nr:hypothetical protein [Herbinix sp.]
MKKKSYSFVIIVVMITLLINATTAFAGSTSSKIKVYANKKIVKLEVDPYLKNGEVMVPLKQTAEALGAKYEWDKTNDTAWVHLDMMHAEVPVGKSEVYIHRDADFSGIPQTVSLKTSVKLIKSNVFVPGKTFFESMGMSVSWDSKKCVLSLKYDSTATKDISYTELKKDDILNKKDVYSWYKKNYKKEGISYIKEDGVMYVLVGAGKKPTGGYSVGISRIFSESSKKAYVIAYSKKPSPDMMVTQIETYPHMLIKLEGNKTITSVKGEVQEIIVDTLPAEVAYEEIVVDTIQNNSKLMKWYNENNQKKGVSYIRDGEYIYALVGAGERPTGGYTLRIEEVFYSSFDTVSINASVTPPGDNVRVIMMITYPSTLIRIKSNTIKTVVGDITDVKTPSTEKWVTLDQYNISKIELFNLDQVKVRDITGNEKDDILKSFNEATIDQNAYIEMIAGNIMKVTLNDGSFITFTSYGSQTNVIASYTKCDKTESLHLVAPVIAKTLLQK